MPAKYVKKDWGHELWLVNTPLYCGKKMFLTQGRQCSLHYHKLKDETFHVLEGAIKFELNGEVYALVPGDTVHIPPLAKHRFGGIAASIFIEFSTHHDDADVYRDEPSGPIDLTCGN